MSQSYRIVISVNEYEVCEILHIAEEDVAAFWGGGLGFGFEAAVEDFLNSHIEQLMLNFHQTATLGAVVFPCPNPQVDTANKLLAGVHNGQEMPRQCDTCKFRNSVTAEAWCQLFLSRQHCCPARESRGTWEGSAGQWASSTR